MCLILISYQQFENWPLIVAANRDELYSRPSAPADFWDDIPHVLAGRDLLHKGTWLGVDRFGRFAAVTNIYNPTDNNNNKLSRGSLVSNYLKSNENAKHHLLEIKRRRHQYNSFNLLAGDLSGLFYISSFNNALRALSPGLYGLANADIDSTCPKLVKGKNQLEMILQSDKSVSINNIFELLSDTTEFPDDSLSGTGINKEWKKISSPIFIKSPEYGTRCSTIVTVNSNGSVMFAERSFDVDGKEVQTVTHNYILDDTRQF